MQTCKCACISMFYVFYVWLCVCMHKLAFRGKCIRCCMVLYVEFLMIVTACMLTLGWSDIG